MLRHAPPVQCPKSSGGGSRSRSRHPKRQPRLRLGRFGKLLAHLLHELPHVFDAPRIALLGPFLEALCRGLELAEPLLVLEHIAALLDDRLDAFPGAEKLATRLEEKLFVQQPVIQKRAGLLPVADHHHEARAVFGARAAQLHGLFHRLRVVVFEEPVAGLAQLGLAPLVVNRQLKCRLLMRRFRCHFISPFDFSLLRFALLFGALPLYFKTQPPTAAPSPPYDFLPASFLASSFCFSSAGPVRKSSGSKNCRTSISQSWPSCGAGARLAHSIASSLDFTLMIQYPPISSLVSGKGPSTTVVFPLENFTRVPLDVGFKPARSTSTPAFASSSLYLSIALNNSWLGILPASESLLAFTIIMNRIVPSP